MGYRILNIDAEFKANFTERQGLEGPFFYDGNDVLYYDPVEGAWTRLLSNRQVSELPFDVELA